MVGGARAGGVVRRLAVRGRRDRRAGIHIHTRRRRRAGLIVFGGGLVQTLLVVLVWPLRRYPAERAAVAAIYRSLAAYAAAIPSQETAPPEPNTLMAAGATLGDPQPFARAADLLAFRSLVDEAERLRASLAALATQHQRLRAAGERERLDASAGVAIAVSTVLNEIGRAVEAGEDPAETPSCWRAIDAHSAALNGNAAAADVLRRRLRAAWRTSGVLNAHPPQQRDVATVPAVPLLRLPPARDALNTLGANLSFESAAFRHGVRLAVTLVATTVLSDAFSLPRGYWISLTALIVLKPEFQDTFARGVGRVAGTVLGATLATLVEAALHPGHAMLVPLVLACIWSGYAVFRINYVVFSICITGYVVFLLGLAGVSQSVVVTYRILDTALGGAAALIAYALWPTWTGTQVRMAARHAPRRACAAHGPAAGSHGRSVPLRSADLAAVRSAGRLARSNAEAAVDRMLGEPAAVQAIEPYDGGERPRGTPSRGTGVARPAFGARARSAPWLSVAGTARLRPATDAQRMRGGAARRNEAECAVLRAGAAAGWRRRGAGGVRRSRDAGRQRRHRRHGAGRFAVDRRPRCRLAASLELSVLSFSFHVVPALTRALRSANLQAGIA